MVITVKIVTVLGWLLLLLLCIGILVVFDPLGHKSRITPQERSLMSDDSINLSDSITPAAKRLWENR